MKRLIMMSLILLTCLSAIQCQSQDFKLKCLSSKENEYLQELYSVFERKLIDHYGKIEKHDLIFKYVNDFSELSIEEINTLFFKSFQIDTTSVEFHKLFIKYSPQLTLKEDILDDRIIEIVTVGSENIIELDDIDAEEEKTIYQSTDYYIINPNSSYVSCLLQQESKNYKVNNILGLISANVSPSISSSTISEIFEKSEFKDQLLQTYIMLHMFILPKLHFQSM